MDRDNSKQHCKSSEGKAAPQQLWLSQRDIEILRLLDPEDGFHYLPTHWIHAFVGGDPLRVAKRLSSLAQEPNGYLVRRKSWYKHAVYARTVKADRHLGAPRTRDRDPFPHRLLQDLVRGSIELGVRAHSPVESVPWSALTACGKIPEPTLEHAQPHALALPSGTLIPDGKPFAIKSGNRWRFVLGMEIDRGTEPLSGNHARRTIRHKLELYAQCFDQRIYATHYGFPNAVVLIVTTSEARMNSMMKLCAAVIGPCSYFAFAHTKDWALEPRFPPPNGDMLGPYQRVGHPPLSLANFGDS